MMVFNTPTALVRLVSIVAELSLDFVLKLSLLISKSIVLADFQKRSYCVQCQDLAAGIELGFTNYAPAQNYTERDEGKY